LQTKARNAMDESICNSLQQGINILALEPNFILFYLNVNFN